MQIVHRHICNSQDNKVSQFAQIILSQSNKKVRTLVLILRSVVVVVSVGLKWGSKNGGGVGGELEWGMDET